MLPKPFPKTPSNTQPETKPKIKLKIEILTLDPANVHPFQVYSKKKASIPLPMQFQESNSQPHMEAPLIINDLDVSITLRKGIRNCNQHPISHFGSLDKLSP